MYSVAVAGVSLGFSIVIQSRASIGLIACRLSRGNVTVIVPRVVEAPTLTSHCASAAPFGNVVLILASRGPPMSVGSARFCQVPTVGTGCGPSENQILCQCEAN